MAESTSAKKHLETTLLVPALRRKYYAESLSQTTGQKICWCSNGIPSEILDAFGINAVFVENYATVCASKRLSSGFCRAGERAGFSQDVCGYARILMGYLLGGTEAPEAPYGGLAKADFLVVNSYSCDSRMGWFATMQRTLNIPLYVLDAPYQPGGGCMDEANIVYTESQLLDFVTFLEGQTRSKLDREKLRAGIDLSRRSADIQTEIYEMRKAVPSPMSAGDAYTVVWPGMYMAGTKECDDFYARLRAEVNHRIVNKIGVVPEEKFRLLWSGLPFWYNMALLNYFEDFGGVVAIENAYFRSEKSFPPQHHDPIKDMAITSTIKRPYAGDLEQRLQLTLDIVKDYRIDGVILAYNPSCRLMYLLQPELKNALDCHGIPNVNIECDMADERTYSEGQIKTRLDAFIERMLVLRK
ncbi:MAG: 2-hydroxyacyl-CoA dehydratase [Deltaproteobacteria bacterium]|nr:2-hydroxyacyl-CoA dehydratase [Deltaproteobacteria bacterium]